MLKVTEEVEMTSSNEKECDSNGEILRGEAIEARKENEEDPSCLLESPDGFCGLRQGQYLTTIEGGPARTMSTKRDPTRDVWYLFTVRLL